jgi:hypothetical protein
VATDLAGAIVAYPDGIVHGSARCAAVLISHLSGDDAGAIWDASVAAIPS